MTPPAARRSPAELGPLVAIFSVLVAGCDSLRATVVEHYPSGYAPTAGAAPVPGAAVAGEGAPAGGGAKLLRRIGGIAEPTDLAFAPAGMRTLLVAEKGGKLRRFDLSGPEPVEREPLLQLEVLTRSEQGLLGLAFAPDFGSSGGALYFNATRACSNAGGCTQVARVQVQIDGERWTAGAPELLLEVAQPYANHNAGQLAFGPEGALYVGLGDGGWRDDPQGHGQDVATLLGSMLRIDPSRAEGGKPYAIPADQPKITGAPPETWAVGLRNPWRFSFAPDGRLIVADVGQNRWEELDVVAAGDNLGWAIREGRHCAVEGADCAADGMVEPFYEYPHADGDASVTGGYVYTGAALPALAGRYVFGDFVSGRVWSVPLPADPSGPLVKAELLGRWQILPSTFGRDPQGELWVADFGKGDLYQIVP